VSQVVRFNWPKYLAALVVLLVAPLAVVSSTTAAVRWTSVALAVPVGVWTIGSLWASHWVYDRSPLADWRWLPAVARAGRDSVGDWVNIHTGFDDTTAHLRRYFPLGRQFVIELQDPAAITERSIQRARAWRPGSGAAWIGQPAGLPLPDRGVDTVFLLMAAHELRRSTSREALFQEVGRVLRPGGRVVLVEHLRDVWNGLAFGPGTFHFYSRSEWRRVAARSGFTVSNEGRITPFVHWFLLER